MAVVGAALNGAKTSVLGWAGNHAGTALGLYFGYDRYKDERAQGNTRLGSLGNAALDFIMPELMGIGPYIGYELVKAAPSLIVNGAQTISQLGRQYERNVQNQAPFRSNTFVDSQQIYTMRQAGLALAEQSKYALQQSLIGDEARFMHR